MSRLASASVLALIGITACCGSPHAGGRTGPEFRTAFPDPAELVRTAEPAAVRERLARCRLPATAEHHDRLLELLRGQRSIAAPHLVLLVEAVSQPEHAVVEVGGLRRAWARRGDGAFAPVADALLREGADRVTGLDARWLGELIGHTQSDATLQLLADRFLAAHDDGSEGALRALLAGMPGSPATAVFLRRLAADGRLDGDRAWPCLAEIPFDDARVVLVEAKAGREETVPPERLVTAVRAMTFDDGRARAVKALAGKAKPVPAAVARDVVASFTFDDGRCAVCASLADAGAVDLDGSELVALVRPFTFDDGRGRCVRALAPRLRAPVDGAALRALLAVFTFDEGRLQALRALVAHCAALAGDEREAALATFTFDSNRRQAAQVLGG